jgi:ankyrin repeat protein
MHAAVTGGHIDVCKVLYKNGAQHDVRKTNPYNWTPFFVASISGHQEVVRWLVLHGALCADNNSEDIEVLGRIYEQAIVNVQSRKWREQGVRSCNELVEWAKEVTQTHDAFITFLGGTLPPASANVDQRCILQCLSGHPGVRKCIADFVGLEVTKAKQLRILQVVKEELPSFIRKPWKYSWMH